MKESQRAAEVPAAPAPLPRAAPAARGAARARSPWVPRSHAGWFAPGRPSARAGGSGGTCENHGRQRRQMHDDRIRFAVRGNVLRDQRCVADAAAAVHRVVGVERFAVRSVLRNPEPVARPVRARATMPVDCSTASAIVRYATNDASCDPRSARLRPKRSLSAPHSGDASDAQTAVVVTSAPATTSGAPKRFATNGSSGMRIVKPRMSRNVIP